VIRLIRVIRVISAISVISLDDEVVFYDHSDVGIRCVGLVWVEQD
jgi:hypothetical protein